jgi:hypothetical protein
MGVYFMASVACAQDSVRYFEQNGATIREARTKVQVPVTELKVTAVPQTYYRQQTTAQVAQIATPIRQPVTQYQWVPKWHGWWNVFKGPHLAYHLESRRKWATTWATTNVPVTSTALVPETRTAQVTVPTVRYEDREQVTRTVMLPSRSSLVSLPSDRLPPNQQTNLASASFAATSFASHPRYRPGLAAASPMVPPPLQPTAYVSVPATTYRPPAELPDYSAPQIASRSVGSPAYNYYPPYGGVARLDGDLPRYSTNNPHGVWQARRQPGTVGR